MKDEEEINEEFDEVMAKNADSRTSKWPAMTYEQGVEAALAWVLEERDEAPYTEA